MSRQPNDYDWREKFNAALLGQRCTGGNLICFEHFEKKDLETKNGKIALRKYAVPTVFKPGNKSKSDESFNGSNSIPTVFIPCEENVSVQLSRPKSNELCKKCDRFAIEIQSKRDQLDEMKITNEQLQETVETQKNEIKMLKTELEDLKRTCSSSRLMQFALTAAQSNDPKV